MNDAHGLLNCLKKSLQVTYCQRYDDDHAVYLPFFSFWKRCNYGVVVAFSFLSRICSHWFRQEKLSTGRFLSCCHVSTTLLFPPTSNNSSNDDGSIDNRSFSTSWWSFTDPTILSEYGNKAKYFCLWRTGKFIVYLRLIRQINSILAWYSTERLSRRIRSRSLTA
jgi:hypothetical protein